MLRILRGVRALAFGLPVLLAADAAAQTTTLDEGSFRVLVNGRDVASEAFTIRQTGTGAGAIIIAQGRVTLEGAGVDPLSASLELVPAGVRAYQVEVTGEQPQRIAGRIVGGRFSAMIRSAAGEARREYLASEGAILLDDGVAHHYYFLARRGLGPASVPILIPRQSRQVSAQVSAGTAESVEIAGRAIPATRFTVNANGVERRVWADAEGRILRIEIPAQGYSAVRTAAPRS